MERFTDKELVKKLREHYYGDHGKMDEAYLRLAELEDKLENGQLVEPPCKIGDTVYCIISVDKEADWYSEEKYGEYGDYFIKVSTCNHLVLFDNGKWEIEPNLEEFWLDMVEVFTDRFKAEARLKELCGK